METQEMKHTIKVIAFDADDTLSVSYTHLTFVVLLMDDDKCY